LLFGRSRSVILVREVCEDKHCVSFDIAVLWNQQL
jgi:hypothetical protein